MTAIQRLMAIAGAADVEAAKKKLLADISRAMTMTQTSVSKGDATAKQYQATLQKLRAAVGECRTVAQVQKVRDELNAAQASRRSTAAARKAFYGIKEDFTLEFDTAGGVAHKKVNFHKHDMVWIEPRGHHPSTGNLYNFWLHDYHNPANIHKHFVGQAVVDEILKHVK